MMRKEEEERGGMELQWGELVGWVRGWRRRSWHSGSKAKVPNTAPEEPPKLHRSLDACGPWDHGTHERCTSSDGPDTPTYKLLVYTERPNPPVRPS
uniref:Uncharacterized protein n=1 Tax=Vespula pensylvanica TaxID=30213 RepID=A0A834K186_VESPE|nr:hypothetical protein H0235_016256 [Vespula pensylvanica]